MLVPSYGLPQDDEALDIYREAMPGYNVVGINMRNVIPASGAIHCITREIAANDPILISHAPYRGVIDYSTQGYTVDATISSAEGISNASLFWSTDATAGFNEVAMQHSEGESYTATIPSQPVNSTVYYYISATNSNSKTVAKPLVAPLGYYSFSVEDNSPTTYTLTIDTNGNGTTTPSAGSHDYTDGTQITLSASASDGWQFDRWEVSDATYQTSEVQITISQDLSATAYFTEVSSVFANMHGKLSLYPNPASSTVRIVNPTTSKNLSVMVVNAAGANISIDTQIQNNEITLNAATLPSGVYLVKIVTANKVWSGRFVKM